MTTFNPQWIIPALPGFTVWWIIDENKELGMPCPIIGWRIEKVPSGLQWECWPILPNDVLCERHEQPYLIEHPSGRVEEPYGRLFETLDEARKHYANLALEEAQRASG